jgi:hypothetical protein
MATIACGAPADSEEQTAIRERKAARELAHA